ncbi:hypothetical protein T492DRAFT_545401 [Pavlovales sp. CCMP2436]|nr:hypothetical protein T492DRAFT_545401 [Pavlovales sp. CCMP2436]
MAYCPQALKVWAFPFSSLYFFLPFLLFILLFLSFPLFPVSLFNFLPPPPQATLPLVELRAVVERGKRLGVQPAECPAFATLVLRVNVCAAWVTRAQSALKGGTHTEVMRCLLAESSSLEVRLPAEADALRTRLSALDAWAVGTRLLLGKQMPRASSDELVVTLFFGFGFGFHCYCCIYFVNGSGS